MDRSADEDESVEHPSVIAQLIAPIAGLVVFAIGLSITLPHPHNIESTSTDFPALAGFLQFCILPLPFALAALAYQFVHWIFALPPVADRPRLRRLLFFAALAVTAGSDFVLLSIPRDRLESAHHLDHVFTSLSTYGAHFLAFSTVLLFWCDKRLFKFGIVATIAGYIMLIVLLCR